MGTNFYLITRNKELVDKYAPKSYELTDNPYFSYKIHVAKTSCGWLPLFQGHKYGINSVKGYKEAYDTGEFEIIDEYLNSYLWGGFEENVLQFNGGKIGVKPIQEALDSLDDDIKYLPVSHIPGNKQSYTGYTADDIESLFTDPEGYEFESRDFM